MGTFDSSDLVYALEVQQPFSQYLLDGRKTIETRSYPLPEELRSKQIYLLSSVQGEAKKSSLPDIVIASKHDDLKLIGILQFSKSVQYTCLDLWNTERCKHMVEECSAYDFKGDADVFGWAVESVSVIENLPLPNLRRHFRSFFEVENHDSYKKSSVELTTGPA